MVPAPASAGGLGGAVLTIAMREERHAVSASTQAPQPWD